MKLTDIAQATSTTTVSTEDQQFQTIANGDNLNDLIVKSGNKDYHTVVTEVNETYSKKDCTFNDIETLANNLLASLPTLNYQRIRSEIANMHVDIFENPTTAQINSALAKISAYKDRLTVFLNLVEHEYTVRKRICDMLFDVNQAVSKQSSVDKRKGEAAMRWPTHLINLATIEAFKSEVTNCMNNMRAKGDTISRSASVIQMEISLGEYRSRINNSQAEEIDYKTESKKLWRNDFEKERRPETW